MKKLDKWPDWLGSIWAKSPIDGQTEGESLAAHTWVVLSRLRDLARLRPWIPELCGFSSLWHVLFWAAFLHDWGKGATGFQDALKGQGRWRHRHEVLSLAFIEWITEALSEEEAVAVAAAIVSHHRDPEELSLRYPLGLAPEDDPLADLVGQLREDVLRALWRWLDEVAGEWIIALGFDTLGVRVPPRVTPVEQAVEEVKQNGVKLIRKKLRAYQRLVADLQDGEQRGWIMPGLLLRGCLLESDHVGSAHAGSLPGLNVQAKDILSTSGVEEENLHFHQHQALQTSDSAILVAPTGSGKTEAALLWAARQVQEKQVPRLFYTLPYQASMNAMYDRLNAIFPGQVGLLHSRSVLALYRRLMEQEYEPNQATQEARWALNLARLRYQPIQVFSPYQMLKAAYQLKGYEVMLADYAGAAFIFDEIHAYDPERLALILELTAFLQERLGAYFFVMSATMPSIIQRRVEEALGKPTVICASDSLFRSFARHEVHLLQGDLLDEESVNKISNTFKQGNSVLVTCNTVARAQEAYRRLQSNLSGESVTLVHGRFNARDRLAKEQRIIAATGLKSKQRQPVVVVSTQVVEVSLNIDLDMLFSDPAPLEALLQRFGRINRGRRVKSAPVYVFTEPTDGQHIYIPALVEGALRVLKQYVDGRMLDESAVQGWLDEIYTGTLLHEWESSYARKAKEFREVFLENLRPFVSDEGLAQAFDRLFDGTEVLPLGLQDEYEEVYKRSPLESAQLLVSISWGRWKQMQAAKQVRSKRDQWPSVVDVPYSEEFGLSFSKEDTVGAL